ncbi:MAG: hypothetical protein GY754_05365 [bacterium]|nr:hypothetical protein [bacterium]
MKKNVFNKNILIIAFAIIPGLFILASYFEANAGNSRFAGSCSEASAPNITCVDYYKGYTKKSAKNTCAKTANNTFSSKKCSVKNPSWSKIPGKCEVTEPSGRTSQASYYTGMFNETSATMHCNSYNGPYLPGYSSRWISD